MPKNSIQVHVMCIIKTVAIKFVQLRNKINQKLYKTKEYTHITSKTKPVFRDGRTQILQYKHNKM